MDYFECVFGVQKFNMKEHNEKNTSSKFCDTICADGKASTHRRDTYKRK